MRLKFNRPQTKLKILRVTDLDTGRFLSIVRNQSVVYGASNAYIGFDELGESCFESSSLAYAKELAMQKLEKSQETDDIR
jgi:hypothetical protein